MLKHLPNALTLLRLILAPVVAYGMLRAPLPFDTPTNPPFLNWGVVALILFVVAALTDLFDGMLARKLNAESKLGRIIDPIADKLLVGLPLIVTSGIAFVWSPLSPYTLLIAGATAVIVVRDIGMTVLRLTAKDGEGARVSKLAKYKTAIELVAAGMPVAALAAATIGVATPEWLGLLWLALLVLAAALSAYTAIGYLSPKSASPKT